MASIDAGFIICNHLTRGSVVFRKRSLTPVSSLMLFLTALNREEQYLCKTIKYRSFDFFCSSFILVMSARMDVRNSPAKKTHSDRLSSFTAF